MCTGAPAPIPSHTHMSMHVTYSTPTNVYFMHACAYIPYIYNAHMTMYVVDSQLGSHNPFVKPLSPKIFTLHCTTVANSQ